MIGTYSLDLKERIDHLSLQGETTRMVAETFKVSLGFPPTLLVSIGGMGIVLSHGSIC